MGCRVEAVVMSAGELEHEWAGTPGRLIRCRRAPWRHRCQKIQGLALIRLPVLENACCVSALWDGLQA